MSVGLDRGGEPGVREIPRLLRSARGHPERIAGGDPEGVSPAGPQVSPGCREDRGRRGEVQAGQRGVRGPEGSRQAPALRHARGELEGGAGLHSAARLRGLRLQRIRPGWRRPRRCRRVRRRWGWRRLQRLLRGDLRRARRSRCRWIRWRRSRNAFARAREGQHDHGRPEADARRRLPRRHEVDHADDHRPAVGRAPAEEVPGEDSGRSEARLDDPARGAGLPESVGR